MNLAFRSPSRRLATLALALLTLSAPSARQQAASASGPPRLVVLLVVDQMRADYLDDYSGHFTGGIRRLMDEGAWFQRAAYPYLNTITCAGHATIGTGTFPYRHGMVLNEWYLRESGKTTTCTEDEAEQEVAYSGLQGPGDSPKKLLVPTFAEQLRDRTKGRVVTMSMKPRAAIMMAGHKGDAVIWFDARGTWASSSAYGKKPVPFFKDYGDRHPVSADVDTIWERSLPPADYRYEDDMVGERPPSGWTRTFPHPLAIPPGTVNQAFYQRWQQSPYADDYLGRMAAAAIDGMQLGRGKGIDFLAVSFSSCDLVGHAFGPRSHEVQDLLQRLDVTVGKLIDVLDQRIGRGGYVLALSADHGVATIPEQNNGGRQSSKETIAALENALAPAFGGTKTVSAVAYTDIYFARGVYDRLKKDGRLMKAATDALTALPGTARVFRREELEGAAARSSNDPALRAAALSYHEDRSGDLIIVPRENWILATSATTHGTLYAYDQHVPLILFGAGVAGGRYLQAATPADIAPTFAALTRLSISRTDGRVLNEALSTTSSPATPGGRGSH
jgi:predicted AlkP superfamily pyrophosphatase or phosphodiesterase